MMEIGKKNPIGLKPDELRKGNINWLKQGICEGWG